MTENAATDNVPTVKALEAHATINDLDFETAYRGTVNAVVPYGIFVDLTDDISGLVHESKLSKEYHFDEEVVVTVEEIQDNGDIALDIVEFDAYDVEPAGTTVSVTSLADVSAGLTGITIEGRVVQIKQTGGPTIFSVTDGNSVLSAAAFEAAGVRAYPAVTRDDIVRIHGDVQTHGEGVQLEVDSLSVVEDEKAAEIVDSIENNLDQSSSTPAIEPLVEWDPLRLLWEDLDSLAVALRKAMIERRPIRIRHHADGDGMCAAIPVAIALERFSRSIHGDPQNAEHLISRSPSKAPYYEMEDATRDLNRSLTDRERHGQRLPLLLMLDNGSTDEDVPAYRNLAHYDIPIAVVDHHHPDESVDALLDHHINPYLVDEDYRVTTGMICVELARMIDPSLTDALQHIPAIAGVSDRSDATVMETYLELARDNGASIEDVTRIGEALDYAAHWLNYGSGTDIVRDILGIDDTGKEVHKPLVSHFSEQARTAIQEQLDAVLPHVETETLANGARLNRIDVDGFAHRFRYPAPGKTTGAVHDHMAETTGSPLISLGCGPDFCVLRSDGVRLDIPVMVDELRESYPGAGVQGGGHLVVGSIKFVPGSREKIIEALIDLISDAPLDADLGSTGSALK